MTEVTTRLSLPLIAPGQAQKEMAHNEALTLLDLGVQACVEAAGRNSPPDAPERGQCWIIGPVPTGAWAGHPHALAGWTDGGWRVLPARTGMVAWERDGGLEVRFDGAGWQRGQARVAALLLGGEQVVGPRRPAVTDPAGGTVIDAEARATLAAVLDALRGHGLIAS